MNFVLAIGCSILFDEWILLKLNQNKNLFEIAGIIGGNITFYATIQNYLAKILLSICHKCKLQVEARSRRSSYDAEETESDTVNLVPFDLENNFTVHSPHKRKQQITPLDSKLLEQTTDKPSDDIDFLQNKSFKNTKNDKN